MSITKAFREVVFDFNVKHPQLEYSPTDGSSGRKRFPKHKNMESFSFNIGKEPFIDRYYDHASSLGMVSPSQFSEMKTPVNQSVQVDIDEIEKLKAQLKEKELQLKELAERVEFGSPIAPEISTLYKPSIQEHLRLPKLKPGRNETPDRSLDLSIEKTLRAPADLKPQNRSFSYEPMSILTNQIKPYSSRDNGVNEVLRHPAFHQARFTKSKPKAYQSNPITGLGAKTDRMALYGNMMMGGSLDRS